MAGSLTITSNTISNSAGDSLVIGPVLISAASPVLQITALTFTSGTFITTSGPVGATVCMISPPSSNLIQLTLKGVTGDTGIPISANQPTVIPFFNTAIANSVGLTSANAISGVVTLTFF